MHSSLPPLQPEVSPLGQTLWEFRGFLLVVGFFFFWTRKKPKGEKKKSATFSTTSFRLLGKPQDFREERVGNAVLGRSPNKQ